MKPPDRQWIGPVGLMIYAFIVGWGIGRRLTIDALGAMMVAGVGVWLWWMVWYADRSWRYGDQDRP